MRTTMDRAGRIVVPKALRARLRLPDGGEVDITERDGVLEIVPAAADVAVVDGPDGPVAVPTEDLPPLTDADVFATIDDTRR